jgi:hypothetical protein
MDSKAIALRLEKDYPSPSMHMDSPILPEVEKIISSINAALKGVLYPKIPPKLLNKPSRDYFVRTRELRFGMKLENMAEMMGGEEAWMEALPGIKALGEILKKNGGPFVEGETGRSCTNLLSHFIIVAFSHSDIWDGKVLAFLADWVPVSYADFVIVSWLRFYEAIEEDLSKRAVAIEPALGKLYDASKQWLERDDH